MICVGRRHGRANAAKPPADRNPQNVDEPRFTPDPQLSAREVVVGHLEAFLTMDMPWDDHGVHVAYNFAMGTGGMERVRYFNGLSRDLYHLDHFPACFKSIFPELHRLGRYELVDGEAGPADGDTLEMRALVWPSSADAADQSQAVVYGFTLARNPIGRTAGCLLVAQVSREGKAEEDGT